MKHSVFSRYRVYIIVSAIIIFVIIGVFYFSRSKGRPRVQLPIVQSEDGISNSTPSLISPLAPVSSLSPISNNLASARPAPHVIRPMIERGLQLYENKEYEAAVEVFEEVLTLDTGNAVAYNARGNAYTALGNYEKSLYDYDQAIELDPFFPHTYYNRGRVYSSLGRYNEALADLRKSIELSPDEFGYRGNGNIGLIYHKQGEYAQALKAFEKAVSYDDRKADTFYFRGETYTALEDYQAAIADYQAAIERFSRYAEAYQSLGYAYYRTGQFDQALESLQQALEISPSSPTALFYLGLVYLSTDDFDKANEAFTEAVESITDLSGEEQDSILNRVSAELETLAQEKPDQDVEAIIDLMPTANE